MKTYMQKSGLALLLLLGVTIAAPVSAAFKGNLNVQVTGLRNQQGQLCIKLFSNSQGFPEGSQKGTRQQCVKITDNLMKFNFSNLTSGGYAVAVYHDANNDNKLNRNSLGMPTEGYGFSNNPVYTRTGPPKYGEAVFLLAGPNTNVTIKLKYGS